MIFIYLAVYVTLSKSVSGANILYVAPFPSLSHYHMMEPLMIGLARRGHHITVLSHYPRGEPVANYTDVSLRGSVKLAEPNFTTMSFTDNVFALFGMSSTQCDGVMGSPVVQKFLREDRTFDLLFLEIMATDCYLGFAKRYPVPYILVNSQPLGSWLGDWILNPSEAPYVPDAFCRIGGRMDFLGRSWNILCQALYRVVNRVYNVPVSVELARKHFHMDIDTLEDVKRNASAIFVNSFHACSGVRPVLPNVIELAGLHITEPKPIPRMMREFLDGGTEGVIVFSMGSMVRSHTLETRLREVFVTAFRELEQRILWKWEAEMEEKSRNVMVVNWMPQSDVLGHKKVKLFISHGGNHGAIEAAYHGVPVLGIPLYGDQEANLQNLESVGMAKRLQLNTLNPEILLSSIREMLRDERYSENAKRISVLMRDRPLPPLDLAIFWTEYTLRHGRPTNPSHLLKWYEYHFIDVALVTASVLITSIMCLRLLIKFFVSYFIRLIRTASPFTLTRNGNDR